MTRQGQTSMGQMPDKNLDNANVLLADTKAEMRRLMCDALRTYGMRNVRNITSFKALREGIAASGADLIVTDATLPAGNVFELISKLRQGEIGENPFIPVIMMTWNADDGMIKKAVNCGVDFILAAPISPAELFKRIMTLINDRKPFVVTSDYIGPDRRRDPDRGDSKVPLIDVPNTLRAKALGETIEPAEMMELIRDTMAEVNDQRLIRHSYQVNLLVQMILPAYEKGEVTPVTRVHLDRLVAVAEEVGQRLVGSRFEHVGEMCANLQDVTASIREKWKEPNRKDVELLKPLSQAILTGLNPERDSTEMATEITGMVSQFAGKINREAEQQLA